VAAPPLDSLCNGPVTYPGDTKILVKSSKGRSGPTLNTTTKIKNLKDNTAVISFSDSQFYAPDRKMFSDLLTCRMFQTL